MLCYDVAQAVVCSVVKRKGYLFLWRRTRKLNLDLTQIFFLSHMGFFPERGWWWAWIFSIWLPFPPQVIYREKGLKSQQPSTDMPHSGALGFYPSLCFYQFSLFATSTEVSSRCTCPPLPTHSSWWWLHGRSVTSHHWAVFQQPVPQQHQKVYLVWKSTITGTHLCTVWNTTAVFTSLPKNHSNIHHYMVKLHESHTSTGVLEEDSVTNKRPPQVPLGYSACCGCTELDSDQKREQHFLQLCCRNVFFMAKLQKYSLPDIEVGFSKS